MDVMAKFLAYANDFEKTYVDDDWQRVKPHFAADALYEVDSKAVGCKLVGPDAITAGIRKSLNGFDRKFDSREIEVVGEPVINGDELRIDWRVTYQKEGLEPFVLRGYSVTRFAADKIVYLRDSYEPIVEKELAAWIGRNKIEVDISYV